MGSLILIYVYFDQFIIRATILTDYQSSIQKLLTPNDHAMLTVFFLIYYFVWSFKASK